MLMLIQGCLMFIVGLLGILAGIGLGVRKERVKKSPAALVKPVCGCGHHIAFHNEEGCHSMVSSYYGEGSQCGCVKYVGPETELDRLERLAGLD